MYKRGQGFENIKIIIKLLCVVKILNTFVQTPRQPTPNSKPSITKFRSTPSITYCCHYSAAMVFRAGLPKRLANHLQVICHQINNKNNIFVQNEIMVTFLKAEKKDQEALLYSFY